ncbi:MAG: methyltransferase [Arthrobacter sp.]|jgi:16S rRNA G1207 methylase RsmC|nr:methyltransferase [Arthrobacter sp.]
MAEQHYFTSSPDTPERRRTIRVELAGREREVTTANGIFSPEGVDKGTEALLRRVPETPEGGTFLDIGCGWGPIALSMALESPAATVYAVDVNERSLGLTRDNATALGCENILASTPDKVPANATFDLIWSNPPIRVGKAALHEILLTWLPRLKVGGEAYLVVQKNLGSDSLQSWLADVLGEGFEIERFAREKAFRVLRIERHA